jgi:ParB-like chromosome segregation protein Spo0J
MNAVVVPTAPEMVAMPAFELRPIGSLVPYARNSRTHSAAQVGLIYGSMKEFGFTNPVLADAEGIVAGHGRVLGLEVGYQKGESFRFPNGYVIPLGMVPVIDCTGWSPAQRRAYIIADNQIALQAGWNEELLRLEIKDLQVEGFDLGLLGFGDALTDLMEPVNEQERDPDAAPPVQKDVKSKPGDTWVMGAHRVRCGSSTNPLDWNGLMGREQADIC